MTKLQLAGVWQPSPEIKKSKVTGNPCLRLFRKQPDDITPIYLIIDSRYHKHPNKVADFMIAKVHSNDGVKVFDDGSDYKYISSLYPAGQTNYTFDYQGQRYVMTTDRDKDGQPVYVISKT